MTQVEQDMMRRLETRVRQLILQDKQLQEKCIALQEQVAECDKKIGELKAENTNLANQYANLKMARMMALSDSDTRDARKRLAKLVRDVDKCIAMLKG